MGELTRVIDEVGGKTTWFHFEVSILSLVSIECGGLIGSSGEDTGCGPGWDQAYSSTISVSAGQC